MNILINAGQIRLAIITDYADHKILNTARMEYAVHWWFVSERTGGVVVGVFCHTSRAAEIRGTVAHTFRLSL